MAAENEPNLLGEILGGFMILLFLFGSRIYAWLRGLVPGYSRFLSPNSLWVQSGLAVYGKWGLLKLAYKRQLQAETRERLKTSKSLYGILSVAILWSLSMAYIIPVEGLVTISTSEVQTTLLVLGSVTSITFITIIFLLQYIENEYHNQTVIRKFLGQTYIAPTIYISLLAVGVVATIYLFFTPETGALSAFWSLHVISYSVITLLAIVIVYYQIIDLVLQSPLDKRLKQLLEDAVSTQLKSETHREVTQSYLNGFEVTSTTNTTRDGIDLSNTLNSTLTRESDRYVTDNYDHEKSMAIRSDGTPLPLLKKDIFESTKFISDIHIDRLADQVKPVPVHEDHVVIDLQHNLRHQQNGRIAYHKEFRDEELDFPDLEPAVKFARVNPWVSDCESLFEDLQRLITESINDDDISTAIDYRELLKDLINQITTERAELIAKHRDDIVTENRIGETMARHVNQTFVTLYLKLSETRDIRNTYETHTDIVDLVIIAINENYPQLAEELLAGIQEYFGNYRNEIHEEQLPKMSTDLSRMLAKSKTAYGASQPKDHLTEGMWRLAAQTNLTILLDVTRQSNRTDTYSTFWNELHGSNFPSGRPDSIENPRDITPLLWFLTTGYLYRIREANGITETEFSTRLEKTVGSCQTTFEDCVRLYKTGQNYLNERTTPVDLEQILLKSNPDRRALQRLTNPQSIFEDSFVIHASKALGRSDRSPERLLSKVSLDQDTVNTLKMRTGEMRDTLGSFDVALSVNELYEALDAELQPEMEPKIDPGGSTDVDNERGEGEGKYRYFEWMSGDQSNE